MQNRWMWAAAGILLAGLVAFASVGTPTVSPVYATESPEDLFGIHQLGLAALAFVSEEDLEDVVRANPDFWPVGDVLEDAGLFNPFKGPVTYDSATADTANIEYTFAVAVNPGSDPVELPYQAEALLGFAGGLDAESPGSTMLPPAFPPGTSYTPGEFFTALAQDMGLSPDEPTTVDNGAEVHAVWPEGFGLEPPTGPPVIYILGARTVAPRSFECPGLLRTSGVAFDTPLQNMDEDTAPGLERYNSYNNVMDTKIVARCDSGSERGPLLREVFLGSGASQAFSEEPAASGLIAGPNGWVMVISGDDIPGATAMRWFEFVTDDMARFNPDYTAASAFPADLDSLYPLSMLPHAYYDGSLLVPPTTSTIATTTTDTATTTTDTATTTTDTSTETSPTEVALTPPTDGVSTPGGFPFPLLIFAGLALMTIGTYLWWNTWSTPQPVAVGGGASVLLGTDDDPTTGGGSTPGIVVGARPGKSVGGGENSPPLIGLRGWKP